MPEQLTAVTPQGELLPDWQKGGSSEAGRALERSAGGVTSTLSSPGPVLLVRAAGCVCALPLPHVVETMRPLPVEPVAGAPSFVRGLSVIRGEPVPVVDLGCLVGGHSPEPGRNPPEIGGHSPAPGANPTDMGSPSPEPGSHSTEISRFVTVRVGERRVALAVEGVLGVHHLTGSELGETPGLIGEQGAGIIETVGTLDAQLLLVLRAARILPDEAWRMLAARAPATAPAAT